MQGEVSAQGQLWADDKRYRGKVWARQLLRVVGSVASVAVSGRGFYGTAASG